MLGNFSFGDYFKKEAISWAWELLTEVWKLPKDRLLATVYHTDDEAYAIWRDDIGLPEDRIIRIGDNKGAPFASDNFWQMADTGPCGPCTEIFYDHGAHIAGGPPGSPDEDGDRYIEIWNLVFMQFDRQPDGTLVPLPAPCVDTGMGLERLAAILQHVHSNYEIDIFQALIRHAAELTGTGDLENKSLRVIADHIRASAFLIVDGVLPSNEGRGYVLRRIMRRAMRHAQLLGAGEPLMHRLVWALVREMGQAYPELVRAEALITETLKLEESRFRRTLARGLGLLDEATSGFEKGASLDGETAFKLYDTYGFPLDLTQDALKARGIAVDTDGFAAAMERQRAEARANWAGSGEAATETVWFSVRERVGATEFLGYDTEQAEGVVVALIKDGKEVASLTKGDTGAVVVNQTPFYGESGGQVGDTGVIAAAGARLVVTDVAKKADGLFVHTVTVEDGSIAVGAAVDLRVDHARRARIRSNHSATHLLHEALRQVLGKHAAQKGSLVTPDRLRFDFSHPKPVEEAELAEISRLANAVVLQDAPVLTRLMGQEDAIAEGAMALFGEKYGDEVRVVSMGVASEGDKAGKTYSTELCGGTHVARTGEIGLVHILAEGAVAAGVRRIEALTGEGARAYFEDQERKLKDIARELKVPVTDVVSRVTALSEERRRLEKDLVEARKKLAMGGGSSESAVADINGVKFMGRIAENVQAKDLKGLVDDGKKSLGSGVVALISVGEDGKAGVVVGVTADLTARFSAVDLVRAASEALGGKGGGGRPDMAQAGGPDGAKAAAALEAIKAVLKG